MHVMDRLVTQRRTRLRSVAGVAITPKEDRREYSEGESGDGNFQSGESIQAGSVPESLNKVPFTPLQVTSATVLIRSPDFLVLYHRSKSLCTVTVETGWLSYALKDPGLFHSTLYHWALLNGDMTPVSFRQTDQLLKVKQVAIHSINERLRNGEISDEVVASVTCLASVNFLLGDAHEAEMHFKGLHAMVASRAGLCQLGFDGLIARLDGFVPRTGIESPAGY
ncbi:hypothetical protein GLAREA_03591 [Glarea lozoyensis ATCC 20868]|uniref:Uncharacterized protein n=1 Tax=Glarea lozoyensis (strain ATCC 20868 / MF5171) TaxID=1116229 RepID=S3D0C7_GLAL2|nr:uncharacterized protein GLAREA_03591 [Glarea lozoyensis ATCC 20868]EPE30624.1 hypothetical protein GLAREA_03591 [Glarea lozoyensis ATCC 20868]